MTTNRIAGLLGLLLGGVVALAGCQGEDIQALPESGGFPATTTFEAAGLGGWTTTGLWHLSTRRSVSAPNAMWYGDEVLGTFDVGWTFGDLSRTVTLAGVGGVDFDFYLDGECGQGMPSSFCFFDALYFQVSTNGGATWATLFDAPDTELLPFQHASVNLSPYTGSTVMLRFHFDSGDSAGNYYEGAFVDNIIFHP